MRSSRVLSGILLVLVFCAVALAQDTGSITGTVTDQSGAAVAGAQVAVSSADHGIQRATTTNASGDYSKAEIAKELGVSRHTLWRALAN